MDQKIPTKKPDNIDDDIWDDMIKQLNEAFIKILSEGLCKQAIRDFIKVPNEKPISRF